MLTREDENILKLNQLAQRPKILPREVYEKAADYLTQMFGTHTYKKSKFSPKKTKNIRENLPWQVNIHHQNKLDRFIIKR